MGEHEIIISKANGIRFAHIDENMPSMDNILSSDDSEIPLYFEHTIFTGQNVYLQIKSGLLANVILSERYGTLSIDRTAVNMHVYSTFKIWEYLWLPSYENFILVAQSSDDTWISEDISVVPVSNKYKLLQWTNFDLDTNNFEFDYSLPFAQIAVNQMLIIARAFDYSIKGEREIYDNQNEKSVIKARLSGVINFESEVLPHSVCEIIAIAMSHDRFLVNEVAYIVEDTPKITTLGGGAVITAEMTKNLSLGMNTHDIGYEYELIPGDPIMQEVRNIQFIAQAGNLSGTVFMLYVVNHLLFRLVSGSSVDIKIGEKVGGDEIAKYTLTPGKNAFKSISRNYISQTGMNNSWPIYVEITGGTADVYIQTIKIN